LAPDLPQLMAPGAPPLVLASASATRARLLRAAGLRFAIVRPSVDEAALREALAAEQIDTIDAAVALAELKALRGSALVADADAIVLGADQLLEHRGRWLEKPADRAAARAQLERLAGDSHRLVSAVVAFRGGARIWHAVDSARLTLRRPGPTFLEAYLDTAGDTVTGSVGSYQLEGLGAQLMARVEGDHFTIQGLPLLPLLAFLRQQRVLVE
jgi:septum formation protein